MQTPVNANTTSVQPRQWAVSHFLLMETGLIAFVPAGPMEVEGKETKLEILLNQDSPNSVGLLCGLLCGDVLIELDVATIEHLIKAVKNADDDGASMLLMSLPIETNIVVPMFGFTLYQDELEILKNFAENAAASDVTQAVIRREAKKILQNSRR